MACGDGDRGSLPHAGAASIHDVAGGRGSRNATRPDIAACRRIAVAIGVRTARDACAEAVVASWESNDGDDCECLACAGKRNRLAL
jgi:hypothetical protein